MAKFPRNHQARLWEIRQFMVQIDGSPEAKVKMGPRFLPYVVSMCVGFKVDLSLSNVSRHFLSFSSIGAYLFTSELPAYMIVNCGRKIFVGDPARYHRLRRALRRDTRDSA